MKPAYSFVLICIAIIINLITIFYNTLILNSITVLLLIFSLFLIKNKDKILSKKNIEYNVNNERIKEKNELLAVEVIQIQTKNIDLEKKYEESFTNLLSLHKLLINLDITTPIVEKLSTLIINKSEESTLNATEKIFEIVGDSQNISKDIQKLLLNMNTGEHSLDHEMDRLLEEVKDFQIIVDEVEQLKRSYISDMEIIEKTVVNIKGLADSIADIADQTSILAINASIEAARAGNAGAGFAVIAGETQKLASDSKQITEKISSEIKGIGGTIASSFQRQSDTLSSTVNHLQESKKSFHQMTFTLAPQIKNIASSVQKSKDLSESVTARLGEITMSLQYQDATRQILEHIVQLIEEIQEEFLNMDVYKKLGSQDDRELINTKIMAKASEIFTVKEEWLTLGLELDESKINEESKKVDLQGDITLF